MSRPQQISRDCQICLGEQVEQVCSALGRALALCHATARRILDDMKRGAIDELNPASARRAASAGFSYELLGAALSARHLMSGHDFSGAFLVQTLLRVPMQVTWGNFCGSIAGVLSRTLWLPFGRSQTSFTISSTQVRPVSAFYNVGGRVGGDCSKMNESVFAMCSALDVFPSKSVLLCDRFMALRPTGHGNDVEAVVLEPKWEPWSSTRRIELSAAVPTRIAMRSTVRQPPRFGGRHCRSEAPRVC
ncbi:hypothetical protein [Burkholderia cepacia]|uniref:hypothetical protein n=1 Tax=Burkholderia cepacia TaxID=292 RepID=UPI001CF22AD7|nr:hypothetical protein [Burkholderia cepacia]MCA8353751.1 hypothetical protein [Burkholderia cepacia]